MYMSEAGSHFLNMISVEIALSYIINIEYKLGYCTHFTFNVLIKLLAPHMFITIMCTPSVCSLSD